MEMPPRRKRPRLEETAGQGADPHCTKTDLSSSSCTGPAGPPPSVYMLVKHGCVRPAYSVFKVDPYAGGKAKGKGNDDGDPPAGLARRLKCKHAKSFVPVRSKHGAWIVGVGGSSAKSRYGPETIILDTESHAVITGPNPGSTKTYPVLLTVGERIYALALCPSVNGRVDDVDGRINFLPWFEVLDLSESEVVGGRLTGCAWKPLPRPPFFPWSLSPYNYIARTFPDCSVRSYASVGGYILVSVVGQQRTYAFDTDKERWTTVDDNNALPFFEGAVPHGPELFLAVSRATNAITAYRIRVVAGLSLDITEIPVLSDLLPGDEQVETTDNFLSLGIDRGFCSVSGWSVDESWDPPHSCAHVKVIAYGTDEFDGKFLDVSKRWEKLYEIYDSVRMLDSPCVAGVFSI